MKKPLEYVPKFSLSTYFLKKIMSKREYDTLIDKYVLAKMAQWDERYKEKKKTNDKKD